MSTFEYLSVFISIVIGLGVVHVLTGLARMIVDPDAKPYWVHTLWGFIVLYQLAFFWWFTFEWRNYPGTWTFSLFMFLVGFAMVAYLLSAIVVPSQSPPDHDYRAYFYGHHRQIFTVWLVYAVIDTGDSLLKGAEAQPVGFGFEFWSLNALFWAGYLAAAATRNERFHKAWAVFWTLSIANDVFRWADIWPA